MSKFDAVIIGGGHNGLVCASYLSKKGYKTLVLEMSLILRLAASLDQRPDKVISSVKIKLQENILTFELLPLNKNHDLLLEKWNLGLCRNVIKELKNLDLKVI